MRLHLVAMKLILLLESIRDFHYKWNYNLIFLLTNALLAISINITADSIQSLPTNSMADWHPYKASDVLIDYPIKLEKKSLEVQQLFSNSCFTFALVVTWQMVSFYVTGTFCFVLVYLCGQFLHWWRNWIRIGQEGSFFLSQFSKPGMFVHWKWEITFVLHS